MTWEECAAAGMSQVEAARHRNTTKAAASLAAKRHGLVFRRDRLACCYLTPDERSDYDVLRRKGKFLRAEALSMIGRDDLING